MHFITNVLTYYLAFLLFKIPAWFKKYISEEINLDAILFHIQFNSPEMRSYIIYNFIIKAMPFAAYCTLGLFLFFYCFGKKIFKSHTLSTPFEAMTATLSYKRGLVLVAAAITFICYQANLIDYYKNNVVDSKFETYYVDPKTIQFNDNLQTTKKLNLVLLYVESLEHIFEDESIHSENLISDIDALPGQLMPYFESVPGTGWTMAGMFSSQCSLPLKAFQRHLRTNQGSFLKHGTCMTDILYKAGYQHFFFVPCKEEFASMDNFFHQHGNHTIYSLKDWKSIYPAEDFISWGKGLTDDLLLHEAFKKIEELHTSAQPFVISIVTSDTHSPKGHIPRACKVTDPKLTSFQNAYKCTSFFVRQFVEQLRKAGVLKNTIVVIMGDHPFMQVGSQRKYFQKQRNVYFKIVSPIHVQFNRNKMSHYHVAPTLLQMLNILPASQSRFGLGMSLIGHYNHDAYEELFKAIQYKSMFSNSSDAYTKLWH